MSAVPSNVMALPDNLEGLVDQFIAAKRDEDAAKKKRLEVEERILALAPAKEEGSQTIEVGGYKLTTTGKLAYKADSIDAVRAATASWPAELVPLKSKTELDDTGCKYLRRERPDLWQQIAKAITVKPAKASLSVGV